MSVEKKFGDINAKIGNGNTIDHIGHKIVFNEPPPNPNSIWQNGRVVGLIGSAPETISGGVAFQKIFIDAPFYEGAEFSVQGVRMVIDHYEGLTSGSSQGRPPQSTYWNVSCRVIG
ncbi:hypothetical protein V5F79_16135 [Xanthobacter flavus]|uniref:hypothetical protein n=1 Tax=Xanthobacter flavus TaxID=281 RepID=UPI0037283C2D